MAKGYNPHSFYWIAFYKNNTVLPQYDFKTGKENEYGLIDHDQLKAFGLFPFKKELSDKVVQLVKQGPHLRPHIVFLEDNQRLVYVRRNEIPGFFEKVIGREDPVFVEKGQRRSVYLLGWQMTVNGKNYQSIMYIYEDGGVKLSKRFNANEGGLYGDLFKGR